MFFDLSLNMTSKNL